MRQEEIKATKMMLDNIVYKMEQELQDKIGTEVLHSDPDYFCDIVVEDYKDIYPKDVENLFKLISASMVLDGMED